MGVEHILQLLRHTRRAVHHQMDIRQSAIDFFHHIHRQNFTIWLAGEFIGPMTGTHGDCEGIDLGLFYKIHSLIRVGQKLIFR